MYAEESYTLNRICAIMASPMDRLTFNEVSRIAQAEDKSTDLVEVRRDFYPALREYIKRVKAEGEEEIRRDPYSIKATGLQNEIKKAQQKASIIFDKRVRKIMLMAMRTASGAKLELAKLTEEERIFYDNVLEEVRACKSLAMDGVALATKHTVPVSPCALPVASETAVATGQAAQMVLIRILEDIPSFKAADREYKLNHEDVIYVPSSIGCVLVREGKAVEISR
jgi:DNA replication initiation complex subunit (GINS family)